MIIKFQQTYRNEKITKLQPQRIVFTSKKSAVLYFGQLHFIMLVSMSILILGVGHFVSVFFFSSIFFLLFFLNQHSQQFLEKLEKYLYAKNFNYPTIATTSTTYN
uniref:Uncharacterized protein n=1 Tax=Cacopsylla melanoneura TaxID=428564 RepID=A0A8D8VZJ5_9HEMI